MRRSLTQALPSKHICTVRPTRLRSGQHVSAGLDAMARKKRTAKQVDDQKPVVLSNISSETNTPKDSFVGQALLVALDQQASGQPSITEKHSINKYAGVLTGAEQKPLKKKDKWSRAKKRERNAELQDPPSPLSTPDQRSSHSRLPVLQSGYDTESVAAFDPPPLNPSVARVASDAPPVQPPLFAPVPIPGQASLRNSSLSHSAFTPYTPMFVPVSSTSHVDLPTFHPNARFHRSLIATATPTLTPYTATHRYHTRFRDQPSAKAHDFSIEGIPTPDTPRTPGSPRSPRRRRSSSDPPIYSKRPEPETSYIIQAALPSHRLSEPQPLLLISDLNGCLILRIRTRNAQGVIANFHVRPGLGDFLDYIYNKHTVMIWTSSMPKNCKAICEKLLNAHQQKNTVAIWARDRMGLNKAQFHGHTKVYKRLQSVWEDEQIQKTHPGYAQGGRWSQKNTLLIDDSTLKASAQPFNLVNVPELTGESLRSEIDAAEKGADGDQETILQQVVWYIEEAKFQYDVSSFVCQTPFKAGEWGTEGHKPITIVKSQDDSKVEVEVEGVVEPLRGLSMSSGSS